MPLLNPTSLHKSLMETSCTESLTENKTITEIEKSTKEDSKAVDMITESVQNDLNLTDMENVAEIEKSFTEDLFEKMVSDTILRSVQEDLREMKALAARRRVSVRVVLPDLPPCLFIARPAAALSLLVREASRGRPWFPVGGVSSLRGCLGPAWRDRRIGDCVERQCDSIFVRPAAPPRVRIAIVGPHRAGPTQEVTLDLRAFDWSWRRIERAAHGTAKASFGPAVASQWGVDYIRAGRPRRSISGLRRGRVMELDRIDGWPADWSNSTRLVCDFLAPASGLRWAGGLTPIVVVWPSCDLFGVSSAGRLRQLPWSDEALHRPEWVVLLRARRCLSERTGEWSTFLQLRDRSYCCLATGGTFENEKQLVAKSTCGRRKWRRALILLKTADRVPRGRLPEGSTALMFRRDGVEVVVRCGRVEVRSGQAAPEESTWSTNFRWLKDDLAEAVSRAMREAV